MTRRFEVNVPFAPGTGPAGVGWQRLGVKHAYGDYSQAVGAMSNGVATRKG